VHGVVKRMRATLDEYDGRVMVGEIWLPLERLVTYYGDDCTGTHLPLNFQLIVVDWNARTICEAVDTYEDLLPRGGWPNWVLGNHDIHRVASRVGPAQARVAAMLLLTLRGTPTMYYGDEIGMTDVPIPHDRVTDCYERNVPGLGLGRDPERTPMQWDASRNAGFTDGEPWLPVAADHHAVNVASESGDERSMLTLYRRLIALRRECTALSLGEYNTLAERDDVLTYERIDTERVVVALNLSHEPRQAAIDGCTGCRVLLSTHLDRDDEVDGGTVHLRENEGVILAVR
jgi:alpha-glucosidase